MFMTITSCHYLCHYRHYSEAAKVQVVAAQLGGVIMVAGVENDKELYSQGVDYAVLAWLWLGRQPVRIQSAEEPLSHRLRAQRCH